MKDQVRALESLVPFHQTVEWLSQDAGLETRPHDMPAPSTKHQAPKSSLFLRRTGNSDLELVRAAACLTRLGAYFSMAPVAPVSQGCR